MVPVVSRGLKQPKDGCFSKSLNFLGVLVRPHRDSLLDQACFVAVSVECEPRVGKSCSLTGLDSGSMDAVGSEAPKRPGLPYSMYSADTIEPDSSCSLAGLETGSERYASSTSVLALRPLDPGAVAPASYNRSHRACPSTPQRAPSFYHTDALRGRSHIAVGGVQVAHHRAFVFPPA